MRFTNGPSSVLTHPANDLFDVARICEWGARGVYKGYRPTRSASEGEYIVGQISDGRFDLILLFEASYYLPCLEGALDEFSRVLALRGTIVVVNANPERPDFIPSPYSRHYHTVDELAVLLTSRGFSVTAEGDFPINSKGLVATAKVKARQMLTWLGMAPRTLTSRAFLKRLVSGPLEVLPSEIP
jgi:hypothetical protein